MPATTVVPERTSSPADFGIASASPVRFDSSISRPEVVEHRAVGRHLIAGAQLDQVVEHDVARSGTSISVAVPDHPGGRRVQQRQPVELPLGQVLLHDADRRVDHQHHAEQPVGQRPGDQDQDEQRAQDRVEPGEDVGLDDHPQRPGRRLAGGVDLAAGDPLGDLGRGQAGGQARSDVDAGGFGRACSPAYCDRCTPTCQWESDNSANGLVSAAGGRRDSVHWRR